MNNNNHHSMDGMMMNPPTSPSSHNTTMGPPHHKMMMMMHMTFYWGTSAEILFSGWPGPHHTSMYILSLFFVFLLAFLVEGLSRSGLVSGSTHPLLSGLLLTLLHSLRMGLAYLVMLAVMSFNGGIFIAAILGHAVGFMLFGTHIFGSGHSGSHDPDRKLNLPPMSC